MCVLKPIDCATTSILDKTTFAGFCETKRVWCFTESCLKKAICYVLSQYKVHYVLHHRSNTPKALPTIMKRDKLQHLN